MTFDPRSFALTRGERGVVISNPMNFSDFPYNVLSSPLPGPPIDTIRAISRTIPREQLLFALTFWDKLVWPTLSMPMAPLISGDDFIQTIHKSGILGVATFPMYGYIEQVVVDGDTFHSKGIQNFQFIEAFRSTYMGLDGSQPGRWTLTNSANSVARLILPSELMGIKIELLNAIPIVTDVRDTDGFLKWREVRRDERRRFFDSMTVLSSEIADHDRPDLYLSKKKKEIESVCGDLLRVASESGWRILGSSLSINFDASRLTARKFFEDGSIYSTLPFALGGLDIGAMAYFAGGVSSAIKITRSAGFNGTIARSSPFLAIPRITYGEGS